MTRPADCIFCRIVRGEAPSNRVYEDADTLAFLDLFPVSSGHTLVIPKRHYETVFEVEPEALEAVARSSLQVAKALRKALSPDGLTVAQLNGAAAGQTVFHYHMHLIPRKGGDPFQIHGRKQAELEQLSGLARQIADALEEA